MLARVHSLLAVVPLGTYLIFHLYQLWPALSGREQWVDRALHAPSRYVTAAWVLAPLLMHAVLGGVRLWREPNRALCGERGLRAVQAATGALALGFVVVHVLQVWDAGAGPHASPLSAYGALWRTLGQPLELSVYLIGLSALSFHVAHGLSRTAVTFGLARTEVAVRRCRLGAGALGFALWAVLLQLLARFALGEPLIAFS